MSCADVTAAIASQQLVNPFPCAIARSRGSPVLFASAIANLLTSIRYPDDWPKDRSNDIQDGDTYDFVVIGSGASGSTVASRLAQRGQRVLLVEAGGDPTLGTEVPGLILGNIKSDNDWYFEVEKNANYCLGNKNQHCVWPKGKVLGGSGSIGFMYYVRGNPGDYDGWGVPGWTYEDVLPYFLRLEAFHDYDLLPEESKPYHSTTGPVKMGSYNSSSVWTYLFLRAFQELPDVCENFDFNSPCQLGVAKSYGTVAGGRRVSVARAYLVPESGNKNLHVMKYALATKIIINKTTTSATGAEILLRDGRYIKVYADSEVIISCGSINTPKLLMLSGIGHTNHLKALDIETVADLPVGDELEDHLLVALFYEANKKVAMPMSLEAYAQLLDLYLHTNTGPLCTLGGNDIISFINTRKNSRIPDIQTVSYLFPRNDSWTVVAILNRLGNYNDNLVNKILKHNLYSDIIIQLVILLHPKSKGSIRLRSKKYQDSPVINPNYFSVKEDLDTLIRGIRYVQKLERTVTYRSQGANFIRIPFALCDSKKFNSVEYWKCYIRHTASTTFQYHGSAGMGHKLGVYGVKGLRVVDGSIMPKLISGNSHVPCIMIGEKAVDILGEEYGILAMENTYFIIIYFSCMY